MHDKPGVDLIELPADPDACAVILTEVRRDGKVIDGFITIHGANYVVVEEGYK